MRRIIEYIILFVVASALLVVGVVMTKNNKQDDTTPNMNTDVLNNGENASDNKEEKENKNENTPKLTWQIVDETEGISCAQYIVVIYEDEKYTYEVANPCIENNIYVQFSNGEKITIKEALKAKKVTVDELINKGIKISKVAKAITWEVVDETKGKACSSVITTIYEDDSYKYQVSNSCIGDYTFVKYSSGEKISIKEALSSKKVTADELITRGVKIDKASKTVTWNIIDETAGVSCSQVMTKLYEDGKYEYQVSSPCKADKVYIQFSNGEKITVREALAAKRVKIEEIIERGFKITKISIARAN